MKIKILVAFIATATIIFLSCNWFRSKKKEVSNPLVGEWKLDSIGAGKDTSVVHFLVAAAIAMRDSTRVNFSFTKDSIFAHSKDAVDIVGYSFDEKANQLSIKDPSNQIFRFAKLNDSLISLTTQDSAIFFLQKK